MANKTDEIAKAKLGMLMTNVGGPIFIFVMSYRTIMEGLSHGLQISAIDDRIIQTLAHPYALGLWAIRLTVIGIYTYWIIEAEIFLRPATDRYSQNIIGSGYIAIWISMLYWMLAANEMYYQLLLPRGGLTSDDAVLLRTFFAEYTQPYAVVMVAVVIWICIAAPMRLIQTSFDANVY